MLTNLLLAMSKPAARQEERSNETYKAVMGAYRAMISSTTAELSREGLTPSQFSLLKALAKKGSMPMNRLSAEMLVTPPNITGLIDRLESKRLIRRIAHKEDRRATIIELTAEGKRLHERVRKRYNNFMQEVLSEFTSDESSTLSRLLAKFEQEMIRKKDG